MQNPALIFDLLCLAILVLSMLYFAQKGGFMAIFSLVGTVAVAAVSLFSARRLAAPLFDYFFKDRLITGIESSLMQANAQDQNFTLESLALPSGLREAVLQSMDQIEQNADDYVALLVNDVVKALFLPLITLALFILFFIFLRFLFTLLLHLLFKKQRHSPLEGPQRILGAVFGLLLGSVYVLVLVNVTTGLAPTLEHTFFQEQEFKNSMFYGLFMQSGLLFMSQ